MITVQEARDIITAVIPRGDVITVPVDHSLHRVIARDVMAPFDFPVFTASAMDGYAVRHDDTNRASDHNPARLKVTSRLFAGDVPDAVLAPGEACRIMTGAMIPEGATAVIRQEEVVRTAPDSIAITRHLRQGENIRPRGEEVRQGATAVRAMARITPAMIGRLFSLGIHSVSVFAPPVVSLLATGSELVSTGPPRPGSIFESNTRALAAAFHQTGIEPVGHPSVPDRREDVTKAIGACLDTADFIIISGGVSVGEKDYVRDVLSVLGVETLFWKVAQKPGKPLFFGKRDRRFVFGLPGNPASALVCFYEYVEPAVLQWMGHATIWPPSERARLHGVLSAQPERTRFLRARAIRERESTWVSISQSQGSHRMDSFAGANCLAVAPPGTADWHEGDGIEIHWIDGRERP